MKREGRVYSLWRVPTNGGEESRVLESANEIVIVREGIYFAPGHKSAASPYPISIRFLDFLTGEIRTLFEGERPIVGLSVSPDRKQILYAQMEQEGSDLMLVENFR